MARVFSGDQVAYGQAITSRIKGIGAPKLLGDSLKGFTKEQAVLEGLAAKAEAAKEKRDAALVAVGEADEVLDGCVLDMADEMVGAGLGGTRAQPFRGLTKLAPSQLTELGYAKETEEVGKLCAAARGKKPSANVMKRVIACEKAAGTVSKALAALTQPQTAYSIAMGKRDAALPGWSKALSRLRLMAKVVWADEPATYAAIFAPPDAVQRPVKKKAKAKKEPVAPPEG